MNTINLRTTEANVIQHTRHLLICSKQRKSQTVKQATAGFVCMVR